MDSKTLQIRLQREHWSSACAINLEIGLYKRTDFKNFTSEIYNTGRLPTR